MAARFSVTITLEDLEAISEELSNIYGYLCEGSGETPSPTMLEYLNTETVADPESTKAVNGQRKSDSDDGNGAGNGTDVSINDRLLGIISSQLRHLKKAVDKTSELCRRNNLRKGNQDGSTSSDGDYTGTLPLESLLVIKDEQIATLREVLKANKQTAEMTIANLKSKYENEKTIVSETLMKLRSELDILKAYKESFISLRSVFVTKSELFITQLNEVQRHLADSEEAIKDIKELNLFQREIDSPSAEYSKQLSKDK